MSPAGWFVAAVTVQYVCAAALYYVQGNRGMALAFGAYAVANVGLIMAGEH